MIGIVILNYQTWAVSLRCMQSVVKNLDTSRNPIYLVDNASTKPMPQEVKQYIEEHQIRYLQNSINGGYANGNNVGIRKALEDGCDAILITNNDIIFQHHAIENMAGYLAEHSDTGIVGPKVLNEQGQIQHSCCSKKTTMKDMFQIFTAAKLVCRKQWQRYYCLDQNPEEERDVYYVSGCCFMMSASCAKQITPLDEHTILYDEEFIIGIRMENCGLKTHYYPKSVIIHHHGYTTERVKPFMYQCISLSEMYYCSAYLKAPLWQIWLLREYRKWLYFFRSLRNRELWEYRKKYRQAVKGAWKQFVGK